MKKILILAVSLSIIIPVITSANVLDWFKEFFYSEPIIREPIAESIVNNCMCLKDEPLFAGSLTGIQYGGLGTSTVGWGGLTRYTAGYIGTTTITDSDVPNNITIDVLTNLTLTETTTFSATGTTVLTATPTLSYQLPNKAYVDQFLGFSTSDHYSSSSGRDMSVLSATPWYNHSSTASFGRVGWMFLVATFRGTNIVQLQMATSVAGTKIILGDCTPSATAGCQLSGWIPPYYWYRASSSGGGTQNYTTDWHETY